MKLDTLIGKAFLVATIVFLNSSEGFGEEIKTMLLRKDGKVIQVPAPPEKEMDEVNGRETYKTLYPEEYKELEDQVSEFRKSQGLPPEAPSYYPKKERRDPTEIVNFEMPPKEEIPGCDYAPGFSFPDICYEHELGVATSDRVIFRAGVDPQSVLDAIKKKYGVIGKYNVMPDGYTADWTLWEEHQKGLPQAGDAEADSVHPSVDEMSKSVDGHAENPQTMLLLKDGDIIHASASPEEQRKEKRDPHKLKIFELPSNESIPGCHYATGFSFPDRCYEDESGVTTSGHPIFRAGIDPQVVLDKIKSKYGITGEHNIIPEGYSAE
jgi:hypothetical protein